MIQNDRELKATLNRIEHFQKIVEKLKAFETNPRNYELYQINPICSARSPCLAMLTLSNK